MSSNFRVESGDFSGKVKWLRKRPSVGPLCVGVWKEQDDFSFVRIGSVHAEDKKYDSFKVCLATNDDITLATVDF